MKKPPRPPTKAKLLKMDRGERRRRLIAWSQKARADGKCAVCGSMEHLQSHHILPKERYPAYRTKQINAIVLCPKHHKFHKFSFHRNPIWSTLWLMRNRPEQYQWAVQHVGDPDDEV